MIRDPLQQPRIYFEDCANYITAAQGGKVLIRCNWSYTDCGYDEMLDAFIARHGGTEATINYLNRAYSAAVHL